jgi:PAS domain S-box-containing protein
MEKEISRTITNNEYKILLVDDKPTNLRFLSKILIERGYKVQRAINGQLALNAANASPPDLILLDIMMPEMDGNEVCRRLKAREKTKEVPIIFLTALNETLEKVKAFRGGCVDYITKPFQVEELLARIENQLTIQHLSKQLKEQNARLQQEISDRKRADEKLRRSEANLATAQRVAHVGSWEFDLLTQKITWSEELFRIFGLDPTEPEPNHAQLLKKVHHDDRALWKRSIEQVLKSGKSYESDFRLVRPDHSIRYVEGRGKAIFNEQGQVIRLFGTILDITERKLVEKALRESEVRKQEKAKEVELTLSQLKRTQAQLIQAEKMSSLGQMVAGVAHEINNPVSFIYGNLHVAREYFQDLSRLTESYQQTYPTPTPEIQQILREIDWNFLVDDWQKLVNSMEVGAERIHQIVRSLRLFSRLDESELKPVDIHEGIDNTLLLLQHRLRAQSDTPEIEVMKNYGQLPLITCYASQLNQVFMNLLSNAIDALESQSAPRRITICTELGDGSWGQRDQQGAYEETKRPRDKETQTACTPSPQVQFPMSNSQSVIIRIADNGAGMNQEVQHQIFDPFFTTKPVGSGTGLGLAISYQIVEKHQGHISCISTLGQGAEFIVEIPVRAKAAH